MPKKAKKTRPISKPARKYRIQVTMPQLSKRKGETPEFHFVDGKYCSLTPARKVTGQPIMWKVTEEALYLCKLFRQYHTNYKVVAEKMQQKMGRKQPTEKTIESMWTNMPWIGPILNVLKKENPTRIDSSGKELPDVVGSASAGVHVKRDTEMILRMPHLEEWVFGERLDGSETDYIKKTALAKNKCIVLTGPIGCGKSTMIVKHLFYRMLCIPKDEITGARKCTIRLFRATAEQLRRGPWAIIKDEFISRVTQQGLGVGWSDSGTPSMRVSCMIEDWDKTISPIDIDITSSVIPDYLSPMKLHAKLKSEGYNFAWLCEANEIGAFSGVDGRGMLSVLIQRARGSVGQKLAPGSTGVLIDFNPTVKDEMFWNFCQEEATKMQDYSDDLDEVRRRYVWCQFPANDSKDAVNQRRHLPPIPSRQQFPSGEEGTKTYEKRLAAALFARDPKSNFLEKFWEEEMKGFSKDSQYYINNVRGLPVTFAEDDLSVYPNVDKSILYDELNGKLKYDPAIHGKLTINMDFGNNTAVSIMTDVKAKTADDYHLVVLDEITSIGNYLYEGGRKTRKQVTFDTILEILKAKLYNYWVNIDKNNIKPEFHRLLKRKPQLDADGKERITPVTAYYEIAPDPSGKQERDFKSHYQQLADAGFKNIRHTDLRVKDRWGSLHTFITNQRISLSSDCHFLKKALLDKQLVWDKKVLKNTSKFKFEKNDVSHQAEALQYGCGVAKVSIERRIGRRIGGTISPEKYFARALTDEPKKKDPRPFDVVEFSRKMILQRQRAKFFPEAAYQSSAEARRILKSPKKIMQQSLSLAKKTRLKNRSLI